jgi:hypothetical protein
VPGVAGRVRRRSLASRTGWCRAAKGQSCVKIVDIELRMAH